MFSAKKDNEQNKKAKLDEQQKAGKEQKGATKEQQAATMDQQQLAS